MTGKLLDSPSDCAVVYALRTLSLRRKEKENEESHVGVYKDKDQYDYNYILLFSKLLLLQQVLSNETLSIWETRLSESYI